jgi:hypothetical protein
LFSRFQQVHRDLRELFLIGFAGVSPLPSPGLSYLNLAAALPAGRARLSELDTP